MRNPIGPLTKCSFSPGSGTVMVYFSGPYLRVLGVILFKVSMLCVIVTGQPMQINIGFVLPTTQMHTYQSTLSEICDFRNQLFAFGWVLSCHDFRKGRIRYR